MLNIISAADQCCRTQEEAFHQEMMAVLGGILREERRTGGPSLPSFGARLLQLFASYVPVSSAPPLRRTCLSVACRGAGSLADRNGEPWAEDTVSLLWEQRGVAWGHHSHLACPCRRRQWVCPLSAVLTFGAAWNSSESALMMEPAGQACGILVSMNNWREIIKPQVVTL